MRGRVRGGSESVNQVMSVSPVREGVFSGRPAERWNLSVKDLTGPDVWTEEDG